MLGGVVVTRRDGCDDGDKNDDCCRTPPEDRLLKERFAARNGSATAISPDENDGGEGGAVAPGSAVDDVPPTLTCSDGASTWPASFERFTEVCRVREASVDATSGGVAVSGGYHFPSPASHQPSP